MPNKLNDLLKATSRSFYLTLRVLPLNIRSQIGLAYLLARTTDTIADTGVLPPEQRLDADSEATSVSRSGALIRIPFSPVLGSRIEVQHGISRESREFRVVRVSAPKPDGLFELGVEILYPNRNFWGVPFPDDSPND